MAPSTYYAAKEREVNPSARALSYAVMTPILLARWRANYKIYGRRKLWKAAQRAGHDIGRDQVAALHERAFHSRGDEEPQGVHNPLRS